MTKRKGILLLFAMVSSCVFAFTKLSPEEHHFVSMNGALGFSSLLNSSAEVRAGIGGDLQLGIGYRLYRNRFIFTTGVEGQYALNSNGIQDAELALDMIDTEGDPYLMHARVMDCKDLCHSVNLNVPLLIGAEWYRFYFLVGAKLNVNLYGSTTSSAKLTTSAQYDRFIDEFVDMPNHQIYNSLDVHSQPINMGWNLQVMAHAELGSRLGKYSRYKGASVRKQPWRYYLAIYADYGVLNMHRGVSMGDVLSYQQTPEGGLQFFVLPAMVSSNMAAATVNNLSVGVKFTVLFEIEANKKSVVYDYHKISNHYIRRGANQTIMNQ